MFALGLLFIFGSKTTIQELSPASKIEVDVLNGTYIFNNIVETNSTQYGVVSKTYTFSNIPELYPIAFTNIIPPNTIQVIKYSNEKNNSFYFGSLTLQFAKEFLSASYTSLNDTIVEPHPTKIIQLYISKDIQSKDMSDKAKSTGLAPAILSSIFTTLLCILLIGHSETQSRHFKKLQM